MNKKLTAEERKKEIVDNIKENYRQVEKSIVEQLFMKHNLHGTTSGSQREDIWRQVFEMILPKKFVMEHSVFIIDSKGNVSNEVDLAIIDETYTPYIFRYGRLKFIPIEAVAAVVECKSLSPNAKTLKEWYESIRQLQTDDKMSITRIADRITFGAAPAQKATRPICILCALKNQENEKENISDETQGLFDFVLLATNDTNRIEIKTNQSKDLFDWYKELNFHNREKECGIQWRKEEEITLENYRVFDDHKKEEITLMSFNFQLNQLLMLINNPMLFPHRAYVELFESTNKEDKKEGEA